MNLKSLLFGTPATLFDPETYAEVILGVVTGDGKSSSMKVTNYPLESGGSVSDHVAKNPDTITIKCMLIDKHPLSMLVGTDPLLVREKISRIESWQENGVLLTYNGPVVSGLLQPGFDLVAENVVITKFDYDRTAESGHGVSATLSLQKITFATATFADINMPKAAKSTAQKGKAETGTSSAASGSAKEKTLLKSLMGG